MKCSGPPFISGAGNINLINRDLHDELFRSGIRIARVRSRKKDSSDKTIVARMMAWAIDNPAPADILLISGDDDFTLPLCLLRERGYNVMVAHLKNSTSRFLAKEVNCTWYWTTLVEGGLPYHHVNPEIAKTLKRCVQGLLKALDTLQMDRVIPTKENISINVRHGEERYRNIDVSKALQLFVDQKKIYKQLTLKNWEIYVHHDKLLWPCNDITACHFVQTTQETWDLILNFLRSPAERACLIASTCRYEAAWTTTPGSWEITIDI
ncbi:hypothetical protein CASFOL_041071 [Castilleja foliolosa]|uniref:NYN domain-containing protein n=1 Tax=Castilleja foliolosa TaxID=1961234 RepID=A0ABD3BDG2_9LAMI